MSKLTKKQKAIPVKIDSTKLYPLADALGIVKQCATAKFDESMDVAVQLGIDAKKSDQVVRGAVVMPNGTGKTKRVAVFAQGAKAEKTKAAGADIVGKSQGTQKVFARAGPLLDVLGGGGLMILDEFDARLHPLLSRTILRQFNTAASNPQHAQLVLTTHDTTILNKETLRRDQVWFTEKGRDAGTRLFSLAELKVRNDASYAKDYVTGRYGAIPFVRNIDLPRADPRASSASPRASKHPH